MTGPCSNLFDSTPAHRNQAKTAGVVGLSHVPRTGRRYCAVRPSSCPRPSQPRPTPYHRRPVLSRLAREPRFGDSVPRPETIRRRCTKCGPGSGRRSRRAESSPSDGAPVTLAVRIQLRAAAGRGDPSPVALVDRRRRSPAKVHAAQRGHVPGPGKRKSAGTGMRRGALLPGTATFRRSSRSRRRRPAREFSASSRGGWRGAWISSAAASPLLTATCRSSEFPALPPPA
jgi:hypothetical protein